MPRFQFVSPGAAATEELTKVLAERDAKKRQDLLDSLAVNRENRADEIQRATLAQMQEQRDVTNDQHRQAMATGVAGVLAPGQAIDAETSDILKKGNLAALVKHSAGQDAQAALALPPASADNPPSGPMSPNEMAAGDKALTGSVAGIQTRPVRPAVAPGDSFTGTPDQLKVQKQHDAMQSLIDDPSTPVAVKRALEYEMGTGKNAPAGMFDKTSHTGIVGEYEYYVEQEKAAGRTPKSFDDYQTMDANRKKPVVNVGGLSGLYNETNPKDIADGIRAGEMPPDIQQYGRPVQGAIASELRKKDPLTGKPFDLSSAQRTWNAQKRLSSTMNGDRQKRLEQSFDSAMPMLDEIDRISSQWNGLGLGVLSRANLHAAMQGIEGPKAQILANQLNGQIGQLTSDIATIEQGGMTPTEESRKIANQSMQAWWGDNTIQAMTEQARRNVRIRINAHNAAASQPVVPGNSQQNGGVAPQIPLDGSTPQNSSETPADRAARLRKAAGL